MSKIDEDDIKKLFSELKSSKSDIAFQKLYMKYNKLIYGIAFSIVKNKEDADGVVQVFFAKLYTMKKEQLPNEKYTSWIYTVTKNEAIEQLRKRKNNFDLESIYEIEDEHNEINNIIDKIKFNKLISKLSDKEKEIVSLKILTNLSFEKIAQLLNEPTGTVKWRYYKSVHTLKLLIANLVMFIISFIIGLRSILYKKETNIIKDNKVIENINTNNEENKTLEDDEGKKQLSESLENINDKTQGEVNNKQENIIVEQISETKFNNVGIGILSISAIFLSITIIFIIFYLKHQLNSRKRKSIGKLPYNSIK